VKKTVLGYGILGGLLIAALKLIEYRFLVLHDSLEIYGGLVALLFAGFGIWLGLKLRRARETVVVREVPVRVEVEVPVRVEVPVPVPVTGPFTRNEARLRELGITPRELEILEAMAAGLSNREISARLFVSENTVKREHREDARRPAVRQTVGAASDASGAALVTRRWCSRSC